MKFEPEIIRGQVDDKRYEAQLFHLTRYAVGEIQVWRPGVGEPFRVRGVAGAFAERDTAISEIEARVRRFAPRVSR